MSKSKDPVQVPTAADVEKNKLNAILSYLGILIIVPLVSDDAKKSPYAKHHMNQGLVLSIIGIIGSFVFWVPIIGWAAGVAVFVIWLMGLLDAVDGGMKKLPLIGDISLIK